MNLADKGENVGDIFKLEAEKEKQENALLKMERQDKQEKAQTSSANSSYGKAILIFFLCFVCFVGCKNSDSAIIKENNNYKALINCYDNFLENRPLATECRDYFKTKQWYKDKQ